MQNDEYMDQATAKRLGNATIEQFAYRLDLDRTILPFLDFDRFYNFFLSLKIPSNPAQGLILSEHEEFCDLPKKFMQHYEIRNPAPIADLEIYPRGVIDSSKIRADIERSQHKPVSEKIIAELIRANRKYGPRITFGKHGTHAFLSKIAYIKMLRNPDIADLLLDAAKKESYFGFVRADYHSLKPRNTLPGWLPPKTTEWVKSLPIIIVPGINKDQLEIMVDKERKLLGLESQ